MKGLRFAALKGRNIGTFLFILIWCGLSSAHGAILTIVLPGQPTATESYAAEELAFYLHAILGERVRIWPDLPPWGELADWQKQESPFFLVGRTRFSLDFLRQCQEKGPEAYYIGNQGNVLFLTGATDRGTLYAVYQYLSDLGCRWLVPGREGEVIPRLTVLPAFSGKKFYQPANIRRDLADFNDIEPYLFNWFVRNRINSAAAQSQLDAAWGPQLTEFWQRRGGCVKVKHFAHSYNALIPASLFESHPEWFALIRGQRCRAAYDGYWDTHFPVQFCTSNPEAIQQVIRTVKAFFEANPDYESFGLIPVDGGQWCECARCRALDRPPRGYAARVITLANTVAQALEESHPDKEILVLAYADHLDCPEGLTVHPRVRVQVCVWPSNFQPLNGPQTLEGEHYNEQLHKWAALGCRLGIWMYHLYSAATPFDLSIRALAENMRLYQRLGVDYVLHECGGFLTWQRNPMATWCWMQLAWDPRQDWRALLRDFCHHYYGSAGDMVAAMFLRLEERIARTGACYKEDIYTAPFVAELHSHLQKAMAQANSPHSRQRIQALAQMLPNPATFPPSLPLRWYHLAGTWEAEQDQGRLALYVDGRCVAKTGGKWQDWQPAETLYIGRLRHRGTGFSGQLDELRLSVKPRNAFELMQPPQRDQETTLLCHFDQENEWTADFSCGAPQVCPLPFPYTYPAFTKEGRFNAGLNFWQSSTFLRFDTLVYDSAKVLNPRAGTIEMWVRPDARKKAAVSGELLDAGDLLFSLSQNVLSLRVGGLTVKYDLSQAEISKP